MKLELFKPELYLTTKEGMMDARSAALQSQAMLNEYIESLDEVFGYVGPGVLTGFGNKKYHDDTELGKEWMNNKNYKARLICIEPIEKKEECAHEPEKVLLQIDSHGSVEFITKNKLCKNCGKKLKAKWEVDE